MSSQSGGFGPHSVSRIEFAKRLKAIRDVVSEDDFEAILERLVDAERQPSILNTMKGLSQEDEFALMTRLMGTADHLIALEQNPILPSRQQIPDFLGLFFPDGTDDSESLPYRCVIEVKSTVKSKWRLSSGTLSKLRSTALSLGTQLVFAVRFLRFDTYAVWVMVEDDGNSPTLSVDMNDFVDGSRSRLWDDRFLIPSQEMEVEFHFSGEFPQSGYYESGVGHLGKVEIFRNDISYEPITGDIGLVAHTLRIFGLEGLSNTQRRGVTVVRLKPTLPWTTLVDALYHLNRLATDESGVTIYDPPKVLATSDSQVASRLIERSDIEPILRSLSEIGIIQILTYGEFQSFVDPRG